MKEIESIIQNIIPLRVTSWTTIKDKIKIIQKQQKERKHKEIKSEMSGENL